MTIPRKLRNLIRFFSAQTDIHVTTSQRKYLQEYKSTRSQELNHLESIVFTPNDVLREINGLDASKACGPDMITPRFLKMVAIYVAEPLSKIFNKSIACGKYPRMWKMACVKPVFKGKGSPSEVKNYRPISLLPCLSKIFERLVFKAMYEHLSAHKLLTDNQSGYRPGHDTQLQLVYLTDKLYKSLDQSEDFTVVYLDISRYFEKIWHEGLLAKCKLEFGITGPVLCWLKSYLNDRSQVVQVDNEQSSPLTLQAGVPQGSVLGPLLAILYLNGLSDVTSNDMLYFADDSSLHCSHTPKDLRSKEIELQNDLNAIYHYGSRWAITFNADKTTQQTFSNRKNPVVPSLNFGGQPISLAREHKHLGLTFSSDLKFKQHVNETLLKFNRALSPLYQIASHIPRRQLLQVYNMYVQPHLDYCSAVYDGNLTKFDNRRLEKAQNRAARLITGTIRRTSVACLLKELGWCSVTDRRRKKRLMLFHKLMYDPAVPEFIKAIVPKTKKSAIDRPLRNMSNHILAQPISRTTTYSRSFIPSTTRIWNELPTELRLADSHKAFKKDMGDIIGAKGPNPFNLYGSKKGNILHTRIRLHSSSLNAHRHAFGLTLSPQCQCGHKSEDTVHFFLHCPQYSSSRLELFQTLTVLLRRNFEYLSSKKQIEILLNGPQSQHNIASKVAFTIQKYIVKSNRFYH